MNYGKAIRVTRALADISQRELARSLGTDPSYISLLEANKREPSREILEKLAEAFKVPLHLLVLMATEEGDAGRLDEHRLSQIAQALATFLFSEGDDGHRRIPSDATTTGKPRQTGAKAPDKSGTSQSVGRKRAFVL
jgi:transcriptional regulator with XRE-family HTH domain